MLFLAMTFNFDCRPEFVFEVPVHGDILFSLGGTYFEDL